MVRHTCVATALIALINSTTLFSACSGGGSNSNSRVTESPSPGMNMTPSSGPPGMTMTMMGADFSTAQSVSVGGTAAILLNKSTTSLDALVMPGTSSGPVSVTTATGVLTASGTFTVTSTTKLPTTRQGPSLHGADFQGNPLVDPVAVSADGNTLLVGGPEDSSVQQLNLGAAWEFTRAGGVWSQQGSKLVGTGGVGDNVRNFVKQGSAVALSADGNTALIGGPADNTSTGAAWVFTHAGGVWTQQGAKLVGTDTTDHIGQGVSVALSGNGNTAAIGAPGDAGNTGAVRIFTRADGAWTQLTKLVGTDNAGSAQEGFSVALSADGTTLAVGGPQDDTNIGAVWVFTCDGDGLWRQQGHKLVGTGATGSAAQGSSVAVSADGNTVLSGGPIDNQATGAVWAFTRAGGMWTQQGPKLITNDAVNTPPAGLAKVGSSVAVSADGNVALIGGPGDNQGFGAAWFFTRAAGVWTQQGPKIINPDQQPGPPSLGTSVTLSADATTAVIGDLKQIWVYVP